MLSFMDKLLLAIVAFKAVADALPEPAGEVSLLEKRDITSQICGNFATVDTDDSHKNREEIEGKDGCAPVAPKTCNRLGCRNTSGFYVCNDQDVEICVPYADAVNIGNVGMITCIRSGGPFSYQVFTTNEGGYNVAEAYSNCNDSPDAAPSDYGLPNDGVNGFPDVQCGAPGQNSCESQREMCVEGTVTVETEEQAECGSYMMEQYVNAGTRYTYTQVQSVSESWAIGAQLGIDSKKWIDPKITFQYQKTVMTGHTVGASEDCGPDLGHNGMLGNWTCGMAIRPACVKVTGRCQMNIAAPEIPAQEPDDVLGWGEYVFYGPLSNSEGEGLYTPQLCVCRDCPGWAEGGAPQQECSLPCAACAPAPYSK